MSDDDQIQRYATQIAEALAVIEKVVGEVVESPLDPPRVLEVLGMINAKGPLLGRLGRLMNPDTVPAGVEIFGKSQPRIQTVLRGRVEAHLVFPETEIAPGETAAIQAVLPADLALFRGLEVSVKESEQRATAVRAYFIGALLQTPIAGLASGTLSMFFGGDVLHDTMEAGLCGTWLIVNRSSSAVKWSAEIRGQGIRR